MCRSIQILPRVLFNYNKKNQNETEFKPAIGKLILGVRNLAKKNKGIIA